MSVEELDWLVRLQFRLTFSELIAYLGLGLAAVGSLSVPPLLTSGINGVAGGTHHFDVSSGDGDERTFPLLVSKGRCALEGDGGTGLQAREVQGGTSRNCHAADDNVAARGLVLDSSRSIGESAAIAGIKT